MRTAAVVFGLVLATVASAEPSDRAQAREHFIKGTKAFDLGLYEDAVREYTAAYQAKADPALLYNIAQAHRQAGHAKEALRFYRVYLSKVPSASNRADVEAKVAELQKTVDQEEKATQAPPPDGAHKPSAPVEEAAPRPAETHPQPAQAPVPAPTVAATPAELPAVNPRPARRLKIAGLATAVVGVAVLGVGFGMMALSFQDADQINNSPYNPASFGGNVDTFHLHQDLEGVLLAVGGAAVVAGIVTYAIGWRRSHSPRLALLPSASAHGAGLLAGCIF